MDHTGLLPTNDGGGTDSVADACTDRERRECGSDVGACEPGEQRCDEGVWGECSGGIEPTPEVCDAAMLDEDCDGVANADCQCESGQSEACGPEPVGACAPGTMTCADGLWGECIGATLPKAETCNGVDDDCNGLIDDDDVLLTFYADLDGDLAGDPSSTMEACEPPPQHVGVAGDCDDLDELRYEGNAEVCDTVDNNCDSRKDEDEACATSNCTTHEFGEHVYLFCASGVNWPRAQEVCRELGGGGYYGLISVDDAEEDAFVVDTIATINGGDDAWWLGLNDEAVEDTFVWDNGSTATFRGWASGQPTNRRTRDCIQTRVAGWSVLGCDRTNYMICEELVR